MTAGTRRARPRAGVGIAASPPTEASAVTATTPPASARRRRSRILNMTILLVWFACDGEEDRSGQPWPRSADDANRRMMCMSPDRR
jgi:hypothetical protein